MSGPTVGSPALSVVATESRFLAIAARIEAPILGLLGVAAVVVAWEAVALSGILSPLIFSPPEAAARALVALFVTGDIVPDAFASLRLLFLSLVIAVPVGVATGFASGWFRTVRGLLSPWIALLYSTPSIALMPLFIVWFGLGLSSQLPAVVLLAFFPAYYSGFDAVRTADPLLIRVARSYGAHDAKIFRSIILPGSLPLLVSGFRLALGKGIIGVIVVELYASDVGLGYLLNVSAIQFRTDRVFAVIVILAIVGLVASALFRALEHRFDHWRMRP